VNIAHQWRFCPDHAQREAGTNVDFVFSTQSQVTVQAGALVEDVVKALEPHGLTLQNVSSIMAQQVTNLANTYS
jgi:hypothetical protein